MSWGRELEGETSQLGSITAIPSPQSRLAFFFYFLLFRSQIATSFFKTQFNILDSLHPPTPLPPVWGVFRVQVLNMEHFFRI
jgi:hypothetical protein